MSELFAYAGVFAMTRENLGFVRQLTEMAQTVDDAEHAASREIGSADRVVEEGVAGEGYVLCLAIEGDGTAALAIMEISFVQAPTRVMRMIKTLIV